MGKVVAIVNQKGGVGKTTTAVNLSASLAELGKRILVVDIDPQGNTTSGLGIDTNQLENTVYQVIIDRMAAEKAVIQTEYDNLSVCPSDIQLAGSEVELVEADKREFRLKDAIAPIRDRYDYILIDCPPSLNLLTLNAMAAADSVLVPVQCEYFALEGLSDLMATLRTVKRRMNPRLEVFGVALTMFDGRTNFSAQVSQEVRRHFPGKVFSTVIPRNIRLAEAPSHGVPITAYDRISRGAAAYRAMAEEIQQKL